MANTPADEMGMDDSINHILQTTLNKKGLETAQVLLATQGQTDRMYISPNQAIPIVFVPGIMGSPLIATGKDNRKIFDKQGKWAWNPDNKSWVVSGFGTLRAHQRRILLNPANCRAVQTVGDTDRSMLEQFLKNKNFPWEEAIKRGWGSIMISSYGEILYYLENQLRFIFYRGKPYPGTYSALPKDSSIWGKVKGYRELGEDELRKAATWRFPVYAVGYNWMGSNGAAADYLKKRIDAIREDCRKRLKLKCDKVIIVTHSMGGLVARMCAKRYPNDVLGVVHGEQPAIGAATAYARVRGGWEANKSIRRPMESIVNMVSAWALGNTGAEVTAVFAVGAGPLELLPNQLYGNHWLNVKYKDTILLSLPKNNNPYNEIYKVVDKWWRLILQHTMVNIEQKSWQSQIPLEWKRYINQLDIAQKFHTELGSYYHPKTYTHIGVDHKQKAWHRVTWQLQGLQETSTGLRAKQPSIAAISNASLKRDAMTGWAEILDKSTAGDVLVTNAQGVGVVRSSSGNHYRANLQIQDQAGDATVPAHSSRAPERHVPFFAEMQGFEHQGAYQNSRVKAVTLYSVLALAAQAPKLA